MENTSRRGFVVVLMPEWNDRGARVTLEICVESADGAAAAIAGGCDRIELCATLGLGGLTPSAGLVRHVLALARPAGIPVHAMVRPRPGGFDYDAADRALALAEARALIADGVQGLVFGATDGARLATGHLAEWVAALGDGRPALTLHRAIDVVDDPVAAVDEAVALGFDHILTSGGAASAIMGATTIARMVRQADGRCAVIAGAGVDPANAAALIAATGVTALHGSASIPAEVAVADRFGFGPLPRRTSETMVREMREVIDHKSNLGQL